MAKCYVELRKTAARGTDSIAADMMRHLHTRQHLGKVLVVTEQPLGIMPAARKQWLKLSRALQKQRAQTLNADKILKYTHSITHMQHMRFTAKGPLEVPDADVYFLEPRNLRVVPLHCFTVYLLDVPDTQTTAELIAQLPADALFVDYHQQLAYETLGLQPKRLLEQHVDTAWRGVRQFVQSRGINIAAIQPGAIRNVDAMDEALDILLGESLQFLQVANEFQRILELARPLPISAARRTQYDTLALLAHRVQALSPGVFTQRFLETYNEDDTFFLHDILRELCSTSTETLAEAFARHMAAGRRNLAVALRLARA